MNDEDLVKTTGTPGTVPYVAKKWSPLTEGLTGRSADICSWAMEEESRHLRSTDGPEYGGALRYVFPVIRRTVSTLAANGPLNAELSRGVITEITVESFGVVHEAANALSHLEPSNELDKFVRDLRDNEMVTDLAGRIHDSILSFPG